MGLTQDFAGLIEPDDPDWARAAPAIRRRYYDAAGVIVLDELAKQLGRGVGRNGRQMRVRIQPVLADGADGPVMEPHYRKSRVITLADYAATDHSLKLFWHAGTGHRSHRKARTRGKKATPFGDILGYHAAGEVPHAPVRDVRLCYARIRNVRTRLKPVWVTLKKRVPPAKPKAPPRRGPKVATPPAAATPATVATRRRGRAETFTAAQVARFKPPPIPAAPRPPKPPARPPQPSAPPKPGAPPSQSRPPLPRLPAAPPPGPPAVSIAALPGESDYVTQKRRAAINSAVAYAHSQGFQVTVDVDAFRRAYGPRYKSIIAFYSAKQDQQGAGAIWINPEHDAWKTPDTYFINFDKSKIPWTSSAHPEHAIRHEVGHGLHARKMGLQEFRDWDDRFTSPEQVAIALRVSRYAATDNTEFVAEVYAARLAGREFDADVMRLYHQYGGPPVGP